MSYDVPPPNPPPVKTNLEDLMIKFISATDVRINGKEAAYKTKRYLFAG